MSTKTQFSVDEIIEKTVMDTKGKFIGKVTDIITDFSSGALEELIIVATKPGTVETHLVSIPFKMVINIADCVVVEMIK